MISTILYQCYLPLAILLSGCSKSSGGSGGGGNNEPPPQVSINDVTLFEGNTGNTSFEFQVSLDKKSAKDVTVTWSIKEGTAKTGEDFVAADNQSVTIPAGQTQKTITVAVKGDDLKEGNDVFTVQLTSPVNATLQTTIGTGTIRNDDTKVPIPSGGFDAPNAYAGYTLAWSDEFNNGTLDKNVWSNQNGDGCPGVCGWGNNELEYYTERSDNLFFQDGKLIIEARPETYNGKNYTSSKIITQGKKPIKFGRIDIRAALPKGKGIWPAFWLMPEKSVFGGWPKSGELDMVEVLGHEVNKTYGTIHYGPGPGSTTITRSYVTPGKNFNEEFHVYSLEWKQDQIKWIVDGNLYSTINKADIGANNWPFNEEFFLIFNLAVGGNWPGNPDASTYFPQWLIVDYVRLYQ